MAAAEQGAIRFAEKMLTLLDEGQFTATYKLMHCKGVSAGEVLLEPRSN